MKNLQKRKEITSIEIINIFFVIFYIIHIAKEGKAVYTNIVLIQASK